MSLLLNIPDEILETIKLPREKIERELIKEMAFLLYSRGYTSLGIARKLAGLTKWEFIEGLSERGIQRHYYEKDAEEDIKYAKGGQ
jgi:predicted HTH domain antitoxin